MSILYRGESREDRLTDRQHQVVEQGRRRTLCREAAEARGVDVTPRPAPVPGLGLDGRARKAPEWPS